MLTTAYVYGREQSLAYLQAPPAAPRGEAGHPLSGADLVEFGRCPWRWAAGELPEDRLLGVGPPLAEWLAFDPGMAGQYFVRRPDTYEAMKLRCPKCNSEGPAKTCTKCGQRRRHVVEPRPWTAAAKPCAAWLAAAEQRGKRIVPPAEWDRAQAGAERLTRDTVIQAVRKDSEPSRVVTGTWKDADTGLVVPVWERASLLPRLGTALDHCAVTVVETRNADPSVWEGWAYAHGLHIRAALLLGLVNLAEQGVRTEHLWAVCERDAPRLVGRRRATPELLAEGRTRLAELLGAYARCLAAQHWPRFEAESGTGLGCWTPVALQPWMTSGAGPHGGYFAPSVEPEAPAPAHGHRA